MKRAEKNPLEYFDEFSNYNNSDPHQARVTAITLGVVKGRITRTFRNNGTFRWGII